MLLLTVTREDNNVFYPHKVAEPSQENNDDAKQHSFLVSLAYLNRTCTKKSSLSTTTEGMHPVSGKYVRTCFIDRFYERNVQ